MNSPYFSYKNYMHQHYGEALFRIPIDFGLGCPNRSSDGSGGCTFCNMRGSRAVQTLGKSTVQEQMEEAIHFACKRYGAKKFMAYIQAFSATFGPTQQRQYTELLHSFDFSAVSIGTRPDCLSPQAYTFLTDLNKKIEVWVELGVQTIHDKTLKRINRGHNWACSEQAIQALHQHGIKVAAHVILGLPGECPEDFIATAQKLATLPIDAVKIHNLHIEKGTTLEKEYAKAPFPTFNEYEFGDYLIGFIRRLPPHIPIMRLTTDTLDEELIAPRWHMGKGQFQTYLVQQMICREWHQGDLCPQKNPLPETSCHPEQSEPSFQTVTTKDQSITFWNDTYKEHYHTPAGARLEAEKKYLEPALFREKMATGSIKLLDICFGLGYNTLTAMDTALEAKGTLQVTALEMDRRVIGSAAASMRPCPSDKLNWNSVLYALYKTNEYHSRNTQCRLHLGDARYTITHLKPDTFDIVFLDAFSTQRNSELWTVDFFKKIKRIMKPKAILLTYCAAIPVRSGFLEAGFYIGETDPVARQRGGTIAALHPDPISIPLSDEELQMIHKTTRGIPYHDPYGVWTNKEILRHRQEQILIAKNVS